MLNVIDEFTRECLAIRVARKLNSIDVIDVLSDLFILRGVPGTSAPTTARSSWPRRCGRGSPRSAPRRPTSSPAARGRTATSRASTQALRDELLDGEIFYSLAEAKVVIEGWRRHYNTVRPHSSLGYRPPAPEVVLWPAPPATSGRGPKAGHALTFQPDHPMGAGQHRLRPTCCAL